MSLRPKLLFSFALSVALSTVSTYALAKNDVVLPASVTHSHEFMESLTIAAEDGVVDAQIQLARKYDESFKDVENAYKWYAIAAEQGNSQAQAELGVLYSSGKLGEKNHAQAFQWFLKSAQAGNSLGMDLLATFYWKGMGTPRNYIESYAWFSAVVATNSSNEYARNALDELEKKLGPVHIIEAQKSANEIFNAIKNK